MPEEDRPEMGVCVIVDRIVSEGSGRGDNPLQPRFDVFHQPGFRFIDAEPCRRVFTDREEDTTPRLVERATCAHEVGDVLHFHPTTG